MNKHEKKGEKKGKKRKKKRKNKGKKGEGGKNKWKICSAPSSWMDGVTAPCVG